VFALRSEAVSEYGLRKRKAQEAKAEGQAGQPGAVGTLHQGSDGARSGRKREGFRGSDALIGKAQAEAPWEQLKPFQED